jgi:hypothetical protein
LSERSHRYSPVARPHLGPLPGSPVLGLQLHRRCGLLGDGRVQRSPHRGVTGARQGSTSTPVVRCDSVLMTVAGLAIKRPVVRWSGASGSSGVQRAPPKWQTVCTRQVVGVRHAGQVSNWRVPSGTVGGTGVSTWRVFLLGAGATLCSSRISIADRVRGRSCNIGQAISSAADGAPRQLGRPEQSRGHLLARQHPPASWSPQSGAIGRSFQETPDST